MAKVLARGFYDTIDTIDTQDALAQARARSEAAISSRFGIGFHG
jgi:hypothetical protein